MLSTKTLEKISELSKQSTTDLSFVFHKMVEEMGEISKAVNQPDRADEPAVSEVADMIIAALDFAIKSGVTAEEFDKLLQKKLNKWESQI